MAAGAWTCTGRTKYFLDARPSRGEGQEASPTRTRSENSMINGQLQLLLAGSANVEHELNRFL